MTFQESLISRDPMIRLLLAYNGNFLCILDADKGGRDAKNRYIKEFGPIVEGRVLTLADINPDWAGFTTENLFSETDRLAVIQTDFPNEKKYSKGKFNTAITNLYAMGQGFEFDKETIARFTELFEAIDKLMPEGAQNVICGED
jgi:DNA primase